MDGEFWHGKDWETRKERLKRNREYWVEKLEENMTRDLRNDALLRQIDWVPIHFWEKDVLKSLSDCISEVDERVIDRLIECTDVADPLNPEGEIQHLT